MPIEISAFGIGRFAIIKNFPLCRRFPSRGRGWKLAARKAALGSINGDDVVSEVADATTQAITSGILICSALPGEAAGSQGGGCREFPASTDTGRASKRQVEAGSLA